jgi:restriction endonuclease S subunit
MVKRESDIKSELDSGVDRWPVRELRGLLKFQVGYAFSSDKFSADSTAGVRLIRNRDLKSDDDIIFYSGGIDTRFLVSNGDILVGMDGDFLARPWNGGPALLNQRVGRILPGPELDRAFLPYCLEEHLNAIQRETGATTVKHLSHNDVEGICVALPPLIQQQRIGEALSDVDSLIGALDQLIAKKRDVKQGAMQQFLTGRTRLPAFSGEWEIQSLWELGSFRKGRGVRKNEVQLKGLPCLRYGELYTRHNEHFSRFYSFITPAVACGSEPLYPGDIVFAVSGETSAEIGKCAAYVGTDPAFVGGDTVILSPAGADSTFLGYALNFGVVSQQKTMYGQGDAVVHISLANLMKIQAEFPPLPEQETIASVLSDMDTEIDLLWARREKIEQIKQGMMWELLTGETRLL